MVAHDDSHSIASHHATNNTAPVHHASNNESKKLTRKEKQLLTKTANRARHRLLSIRHDVVTYVKPTLEQNAFTRDLPLLSNERCGSWYAPSTHHSPQHSCYFKSTDGHVGTYNFSLKRLNLNVVDQCSHSNGCIIVDASVRKEMPDSFSRTIPIWCAVLNRIVARYRQELGMPSFKNWDESLYTPSWLVSKEEHATMEALIDIRVQELYDCHAIVDPQRLAETLVKPLRPYWHNHFQDISRENYYVVVCLNASQHVSNRVWMEDLQYWYTPGAADDQESWARHLTPQLFWNNVDKLLDTCETDDQVDAAIDAIVSNERLDNDILEADAESAQKLYNLVGNTTNIAIGTRRAGRPPDCWKQFDAILNVTDTEYPDVHKACQCQQVPQKFYLQLPVKEGKRDRSELERWMAVGIAFCIAHSQKRRTILVHCAQGRDRSVAIVMATIVLFCDLTFPLRWKEETRLLNMSDLEAMTDIANYKTEPQHDMYQYSGLSKRLVNGLQGREGRDCLLQWVRKEFNLLDTEEPLATKETLRIALHLIRQDREMAEPSRSTMQKLNRFFMSGTYDK